MFDSPLPCPYHYNVGDSSSKPVFFDPNRKRWKRIRRTFDVLGLLLTLLVVFFVITVVRGTSIPTILLADQKKNYRALQEKEVRHPKLRGTHRKTTVAPSQVVLNTDEGIRGAFYVMWDAASYSSMREYVHQIDFVFPEWLHVLTPDGHLQGVTELNTLYPVIEGAQVRQVDPKLMAFLKQEKAETEVFPLVNNFDPVSNTWREDVGAFLENEQGRERFRHEIAIFLAQDRYKGLTLDIEAFPEKYQPGFLKLVEELSTDLHRRNMKLYVSVPINNRDFDYEFMAKHADGLILMNYDQHFPGGEPGAVAGQDWFTRNLQSALKEIPREKIICAIGNYGYDWTSNKGQKPGLRQASTTSACRKPGWRRAMPRATSSSIPTQ
jgi:hypothetical protein